MGLKANELRVGNLVYYNGNHKHIGTVTSLQPKYVLQCCNYVEYSKDIKIGLNNRFDILYDIDKIKPIPLTEEWLLKFGAKLEKTEEHDWYFFENVYVNCGFSNIGKTEYWYMYQEGKPIKFVHELQNLIYALTGEELIINFN